MLSLPIPDKHSPIAYSDILYDGESLGPLVSQLTRGRIPPHYRAHLDPDLVRDSLPRMDGWRPLFGQTGPAQSHLRNHGVGADDLFLFFGLFRRVEEKAGVYIWARDARPCHVIWGWLQVEEVLHVDACAATDYPWARNHPHLRRDSDTNNVLYVSRRNLLLPGLRADVLSGADAFTHLSPALQLTSPTAVKPSLWCLPGWFLPAGSRPPLSYHADPARWRRDDEHAFLQSAARGQEFVLDCDHYPEAIRWAHTLLSTPCRAYSGAQVVRDDTAGEQIPAKDMPRVVDGGTRR